MDKILLSIKPEYVTKIFDGSKRYEFRKRIPNKPINKVVVYSTKPDQGVVGEFEVLEIIEMKPSRLWETTKGDAGVSRARFRLYFQGSKSAYAYKIGRVIRYDPPKTLKDYGISNAPQSFVYLNETQEYN